MSKSLCKNISHIWSKSAQSTELSTCPRVMLNFSCCVDYYWILNNLFLYFFIVANKVPEIPSDIELRVTFSGRNDSPEKNASVTAVFETNLLTFESQKNITDLKKPSSSNCILLHSIPCENFDFFV